MKKLFCSVKKRIILSSLILSSLGFSSFTHAEWNGDEHHSYFSDVTIKHISTGQMNNGPYFCISLYRDNTKVNDVCSLSTGHMWSASFDTMYNQAMYFYSSGQKIRVYTTSIKGFYPKFESAFSDLLITGFGTCEDDFCYGPSKDN